MKKITILAVATAALLTPAFAAETTAQKNGWSNYTMQLSRVTESVNKVCETKITAAYDKSSYKNFDPASDRTQSLCQNGVNALASICKAPSGKASAQKITSVSCRFSKEGTSVALEGEKLIINANPVAPAIVGKKPGHNYNWAAAVREQL